MSQTRGTLPTTPMDYRNFNGSLERVLGVEGLVNDESDIEDGWEMA